MARTPLHTQILSVPAAQQDESPLFGVLPAEVRSSIFALALTDYPDPAPDNQYAAETCYTRPHYFAPRKSDTALLRTCRAAYAEGWFLPFMLEEQAHWLTAQDRAPPEYRVHRSQVTLRTRLQQIKEQRGDDEIVEIEGLRVFAQMYKLEGGHLAQLLKTPGLYPRRLTLTIRHTDWWYWEEDQPLRFEADWIQAVCKTLPSSVREFWIELESLEKKKGQVDSIAKQMREKWFFKRTDGAALFADVTGKNVEVSRWSGTSRWHNLTWTRDETTPGKIDYYIVSVPFRLQYAVERQGGGVSDEAMRAASSGVFNARKMRLDNPREGR
ncbi:hypothetical protein F4821DRAFT_230895 [Hypoxylon rubiginosum]|uniref:Uncharacterized protein n=1 Tax=Hypoxylon rubiginosum TaxID=110542 RepID=A0ACC0DBJ9_9PEZI|nr:hypothetical protein F4821DRAFT_230895 [Hypoxylon rubiginosum]